LEPSREGCRTMRPELFGPSDMGVGFGAL